MGWFSRRKSKTQVAIGPSDGPQMAIDRKAAEAHLREFIASRRGVEAYVEPPTSVSPTTVVLIAHDGEWTRRALGTQAEAWTISRKLEIPVYDVNQTGYPNRMRQWNTRQRRTGGSPE
ncbi:MAG: hypothetical protein L0H25_05645 [Micrococcales bacterium]|nr:hypothetical protein [Micrococcales bacterium]